MKTTKRILAVLMAVMLVFALCVTSVSAAGTETLTVSGDELGGKTVTIVPMFTGGKTNGVANYQLVDEWKAFFATKTGVAANSPEISSKAYQYMIETAANDMVAFAAEAKAYYLANTATFASVAQTQTASAADVTPANTATFTNLEAGSYLVIPESGSTSTTRDTDAIITNVVAGGTNSVQIKTEYPTVDKTVSTDNGTTFADDGSAQVGDTVTYKLEAAVPDMTDYTTYMFQFVDTMSAGLTYVPNSVSVTIDNVALTVDTDYTVTADSSTNTLTINLGNGNFKALATTKGYSVGDEIVVTYNAKVNENAVVGGNENSVKVKYTHNPSNPQEGESTPDISTVYTYSIVIDKYTMDEDSKVQLAGAVFQISATIGGDAIQLVETATDTYRVATDTEIADTSVEKVTQVTTPASGLITIEGLEAGTYYVKEVTAPTGYNGLDAPVAVLITKGATFAETTYKVGNSAATTSNIVGVLNNPGALLPVTGGVGTIIFTIIGVGVIIAGVMFTSRKKKENE